MANLPLIGKVAVVTGASRGIGRALAIALAGEGCDLVLASKSLEADPRLPGTLLEVKREIEALGRRALAVKTDVRDATQIDAMAAEALAEFGHVDLLINNAGALYWHPIVDTPASRFDLVLQVNARASFLCARAFLPSMVARRGGVVINMSPPIVPEAATGHVAYMISKYGMTLVAEGIAGEHGAEGVRAYSLWPATLIESQATIGHALGGPEQWRKADILVDAALALIESKPGAAELRSGGAYYDEDVLRATGTTDFARYACVPGATPPSLRLDDDNASWFAGARAGRKR
ncbi:MAG: SDR family oxidoreductase [Polyangiales bacterium]